MECKEAKLLELLRGELSQVETEAVLAHIEECEDCHERFRIMAILETESDLTESQETTFWNSKFSLVAACVLVALVASVLYQVMIRPKPASVELIRLATSEAYPYFPTETRDAEGLLQERIQSAFDYYVAENYLAAMKTFPTASDNPEIRFYRGVSAYMAGQLDSAHVDLSRASQSEIWEDPAHWYLANTYLKQERIEDAIRLMKSLRSNPEYAGLVEALLARLETVD